MHLPKKWKYFCLILNAIGSHRLLKEYTERWLVPVARGGVHSAWLVLVLATCSKPLALESGCLDLTLYLQEVTCLHNAGSIVQKDF